MKIKEKTGIILAILAVIFTISLTFVSVELPRLADSVLSKNIHSVDVATGSGEQSEYKTELYLKNYNLRWIGYGAFVLIIILIVAGFISNRSRLSAAGAIFLFLPVFGHFALTMFFLGGLAFIRILWLPILDISFAAMRLADIVSLPYQILLTIPSWFGVYADKYLPYAITALGLLIFVWGVLAWFYARIANKWVADFWIYRISRHPQYLGWIIWSYGIMFLPGCNMKVSYGISNSLPWLLSTMIIIGVAMLEEIKMKHLQGEEYERFHQKTPFLFPLPRFISNLISLPLRLIFKKRDVERKREIAGVLGFYTVFIILVSLLFGSLSNPLYERKSLSGQQMEKLAQRIKTSTGYLSGKGWAIWQKWEIQL